MPSGGSIHTTNLSRIIRSVGSGRLRHQVDGFHCPDPRGVGLTGIVPFPAGDILKENDANHEKGDGWSSFALRDGKLVTGQNPAPLR